MQAPLYMPLLRGKYYELQLLGRNTSLLRKAPIVPIIEPVSRDTGNLEKLVQCFSGTHLPMGVIVNPAVGDFVQSPIDLQDCLSSLLARGSAVFPVVRTAQGSVPEEMLKNTEKIAVLQDSAVGPDFLQSISLIPSQVRYHIVDTAVVSPLDESQRLAPTILLCDGFIRRRNVDYPPDEAFLSGPRRLDLRGALGWSDYSIVGAKFSQGGGRPYAVAIHITYWDSRGAMRVRHYLSDSNAGPDDPAGKFGEAVGKLVQDVDQNGSNILETTAVQEFRLLHQHGDFPGLGPIKRLSMHHHFETVSRRPVASTGTLERISPRA